jgi:hypothetical protein
VARLNSGQPFAGFFGMRERRSMAKLRGSCSVVWENPVGGCDPCQPDEYANYTQLKDFEVTPVSGVGNKLAFSLLKSLLPSCYQNSPVHPDLSGSIFI